jgi:hypothetical protein
LYKTGKPIHAIQHINKIKDKKYIISIDSEKDFDKIQHPFMTKALKKLGIEGSFLSIIKAICSKPITDILLNGEKQRPFPPNSGMRQGYQLL